MIYLGIAFGIFMLAIVLAFITESGKKEVFHNPFKET
jgi:hypothetical protein